MSNTVDYGSTINEAALALFVQDGNTDTLTDILVDALNEAFRILDQELACRPLN